MIKSLDEQLAAAEAKNGEIKNYIDSLNAKISKDFGLAKGVYEKAVKLTTYTVKDHEEKNVTYYLAYYNSQSNEIKATEKETTELDSDDKKEIPIPATLENLLNAGIKVQIGSGEENKVIKTEDFNQMKLLGQNTIIVKVLEKVLKEIRDGGQKLADFFQNKLNELTKLKKDLETLNEVKFFEVLKKIESSLEKGNWEKMSTLDKLNKIKRLLTNLEGEWDKLSGGVNEAIKGLEDIVQEVENIANRAKNDGAPSKK